MDEKQTIIVLDQNGKEAEAEIIAKFSVDETGKQYILYTLNEIDENSMVKIYASTLVERDGMYSLETIGSDEEWAMIKEVMREMAKESQE